MIRIATVADAPALTEHHANPETGFYPLEMCQEALGDKRRIWLTDGEGAFLGISLTFLSTGEEVVFLGPLYPIQDMAPRLALQLVKRALAEAWERWPEERKRRAVTLFPPESRAAAEFFAGRFGISMVERGEHRELTLPTLTETYKRARRWRV